MEENTKLELLTREELAKLPVIKVSYVYNRDKSKNKAEVLAVLKLDERLKVEIPMTEGEVRLLLQEHGLMRFDGKHQFEKPYELTKGITKRKNYSWPWYKVRVFNSFGVPGVIANSVIRVFLDKDSKRYVLRDKKLNALFQEIKKTSDQ